MDKREASEVLLNRAGQVRDKILRIEGLAEGKLASYSRRELSAIHSALRALKVIPEDDWTRMPPLPPTKTK